MAVFDSNSPQRRSQGQFKVVFWNIMTLMVLVGIVVLAFWFLFIYQFPESSVNPFPPPTEAVPLLLPSVTPTRIQMPATFTPEPTRTLEPTRTPVPPTLTASPTIVGAGISLAVSNTPDANANYPFALQSEPSAIDASVLYPDRGCQWLGVGGQVTDMQGRPVTGITVQLGGALVKQALDQTSLTGLATKYGEAGYEFELAKEPTASKDTAWIRLIDQARLPLSARVYFETYNECTRNLTIVNFRQVR